MIQCGGKQCLIVFHYTSWQNSAFFQHFVCVWTLVVGSTKFYLRFIVKLSTCNLLFQAHLNCIISSSRFKLLIHFLHVHVFFWMSVLASIFEQESIRHFFSICLKEKALVLFFYFFLCLNNLLLVSTILLSLPIRSLNLCIKYWEHTFLM